MLMIPPALTTKSGAHRMPRACSSSATSSARSWLFAAPATARQRRAGHGVVVEQAAERARGEQVDVGAERRGRVGPRRAELLRERALGRVDVGEHELGARLREQPRQPPADLAEADHRDAPARERRRAPRPLARDADGGGHAERGPRARVARAAAREGEAGDVRASARRSPPCRRRTCRRPRRSRSARRGSATASPKSSRAARRRSGSSGASPGGSMITPLPPPSGRSATADFAVIARESRSASRTPARVSA